MSDEPVASLYTTHNQTTPTKTTSAIDLMNMVRNPANTPKGLTALVTPTTAPGKTKDVVLAHDQMTECWVDIDHGNMNIDGLLAVAAEHGLHDILIYSTASATDEDKRWRILVFLSRSMSCDEWQPLQEVLAKIFDGDLSAARITQGFYAPTCQDGGFYEKHVGWGHSLVPDNLPTALKVVLDEIKFEREAQQEAASKAPVCRSEARSQGESVIGLVNDAYSIEMVMDMFDYKYVFGNRWMHPDSKSKKPGVVLLENENGETRYYSHHSQDTDPLADRHSHDAFDLVCHHKFGGDVKQAVAYYANELDPEGQHQRQKEYAVERSRTRFFEGFSGLVAADDVHNIAAQIVDWPHQNGNGGARNTLPNFQSMLSHYNVLCRYNVIRKEVEIIYSGMRSTIDNAKNVGLTQMISLAALNGFPQTRVREYALAVADQHQYNPITDLILSVPWDRRSRIGDLYNTIKLPPGYNHKLMELLVLKWLISAVAAVAKPTGFHSRGVLVFQGQQGIGKTSWLRRLLPQCVQQYFKEGALLDPSNKDTILAIITHWIVELGELDATFRKADLARLKAFITQPEDKIRRPYGLCESEYQRRTVFCASVNEPEFLVDSTGNSRFWVIPVVGLDYEHSIDMQQLWAEIYDLFQAGEQWWLTPDEERLLEESNGSYRHADAIEEMLTSNFAVIPDNHMKKWMTTTELLRLTFDIREPSNAQLQTTGKVLTQLKFDKKRQKTCRLYEIPVNPLTGRASWI